MSNANTIPTEFHESIRQALKYLYDLGQLQRIVAPLARYGSMEARTSNARFLQVELVKAVDQLRPLVRTDYLSVETRLFNLVHGHYVEGLSIEHVARENAVSVRQAHRDLRRGEEAIAAMLWESLTGKWGTQVAPGSSNEFLDQEVASLGKQHAPLDLVTALRRACGAVEPLADLRQVALLTNLPAYGVQASGNQTVAQQLLVSLLSFVLQRARPGSEVSVAIESPTDAIRILLLYEDEDAHVAASKPLVPEAADRLTRHLGWRMESAQPGRIELSATPSSRQVLVVDDNEGLIDLMSHYLGEHGYEVVGCLHSPGAVDAAINLKPSFIVLDVMMPEQDGWQVLKTLKANQATQSVPVVICSVFEDRALARSLAACCYLAKPVTRQSIAVVLDELSQVMGGT